MAAGLCGGGGGGGGGRPVKCVTGLQIAGVRCDARRVLGLQATVVHSCARAVKGVQIGLVNRCAKLAGVQIGLINISSEHPFPILPIINPRLPFWPFAKRDEEAPPEED